MKDLLVFPLVLACLMLGACVQGEDTEADREAITTLHNEWVSAIERLDIDGDVALWAEDGVVMQPNELSYVGKDRIRDRIQFFDEVTIKDLNVSIEELEVAGDWAFIRQSFKATWTPKNAAEPIAEDGKEIMILRRQPDNSWRIARYIWNTNLPSSSAPKWAKDLIEAWYAAYNAGDVDGVARLYSDEAVGSEGVRGLAAIKVDLAARFAETRFECSGGFDGFQETAGNAVGWGNDTCTETPVTGGPSKTTQTRWLAVYERQPDGTWLTVRDVGEGLAP